MRETLILLLFIVFLFGACTSSNKVDVEKLKAEHRENRAVQMEELEAFGPLLERHILANDGEALIGVADMHSLLQKGLWHYDIPLEPGELEETGNQYNRVFAKFMLEITKPAHSIKHIRSVFDEKDPYLIYRIVYEDAAVNYLFCFIGKRRDKLVVQDILPLTSGECLSTKLGRVYGMMMVESDQTSESNFKHISTLNDYMRLGLYSNAMHYYENKLPRRYQSDLYFQSIRINIAQQLGELKYLEVLETYDSLFGNNDTLAMTLIPLDLARKDFSKAWEHVETVDKIVGGDSYLNLLRAAISLAAQDPEKALKQLNNGDPADKVYDKFSLLLQTQAAIIGDKHLKACLLMDRLIGEQGYSKYALRVILEDSNPEFCDSEIFKDWYLSEDAVQAVGV